MTKKMQNLLTFPKLSDPRPPTYITLGTQKFGNFVLFETPHPLDEFGNIDHSLF